MKKIITFGFRHGKPDGVIIDVRQYSFRNAYGDRRYHDLDGTDPKLQEWMRGDLYFQDKYDRLKEKVVQAFQTTDTIYVGCMGGQHRSVALAHMLARDLGCMVEHSDLPHLTNLSHLTNAITKE